MLTHFEKPEESKELYFKLSNSFHLTMFEDRSPTSRFAGLYAIFKNGVCMYVGQSQNLASRVSQHLSGKYKSADKVLVFSVISNGFGGFFDFIKDDRKFVLENNEKLLIKELQPIENLMLPEDGYDLSEHHQFDLFALKDEGDDYIDFHYSSRIDIGRFNISISSAFSVTGIEEDAFFKQYNDFIEHINTCNKTRQAKGGL